MITLLVQPDELDGSTVSVTGEAHRHLFRARRVAMAARIRLVDGQGRARWSRVAEISNSRARLEVGGSAPANEPSLRLELLVTPPRSHRLAWLVEKATELGVVAIRLVGSERSPRKLHTQGLRRLLRVAVAAVEQSHRSVVPQISGVHRWEEIGGLLEAVGARWVLRPGASATLKSLPVEGDLAVVVGPEGGWAEHEIAQLGRWGCRPLGLGPTTLRVETAAVVGAARLLLGAASP